MVTDDAQMKFEGGSVRMYLDDCHLTAFLIDVLVERDQPRLIGLDETGQGRGALLLGVESALPEPVGGDEDEWSGHGAPCLRRVSCGAGRRNPMVLWHSVTRDV